MPPLIKISIKDSILIMFAASIINEPRKNIFSPVFSLISFVNKINIPKSMYAEAAAQAGMNVRAWLFVSIVIPDNDASYPMVFRM